MDINVWGVIAATVAQFIVGAVWYTFVFGKVWGQIHGFDKLDKETQQQMAKEVMPFYGVQLVLTILTALVLAQFLNMDTGYSTYMLAFWAWLGFVVPTQVSSVIFGGTDGEWIIKKSLVMAGGSLACLMVGVAILSLF